MSTILNNSELPTHSSIVPDLVSTIIPVRNRPKLLSEAVESVLAQTYRPIEILIVDDGSTDETLSVARDYERRYPQIVRVIAQSYGGRGPGPIREAGRLAARGEYLQYLDSDDLLWPCKFAVQVEALKKQPDCGVSYGWTRFCPADAPPQTVPFKWTGQVFERIFPALLVDRWWCTNTPLYRRTVTDAAGPWTDVRWGQDWAYDSRVGALGLRLAYCDQFLCDWREHHGVRQTTPANQYTYERLWEYHRLQDVVFAGAIDAGIEPGTAEMLHFSRVEFMISRGLAALGAAEQAKLCFDLARRSAGPVAGNSLDYRAFERLTRLFGWTVVGKLSRMSDFLRWKGSGRHSMNWSWAGPPTPSLEKLRESVPAAANSEILETNT